MLGIEYGKPLPLPLQLTDDHFATEREASLSSLHGGCYKVTRVIKAKFHYAIQLASWFYSWFAGWSADQLAS